MVFPVCTGIDRFSPASISFWLSIPRVYGDRPEQETHFHTELGIPRVYGDRPKQWTFMDVQIKYSPCVRG